MNLNDNPERLVREEQRSLDKLISRMEGILSCLDDRMREYVREARNTDISINPDAYLSIILAQKGLDDTKENRKKILQARDELYHTRLLLHYDFEGEQGVEEVKVGLHSCIDGAEHLIVKWDMPICRHFILDPSATENRCVVTNKHGDKFYTDYKLIVKNQIKLRFTRVVKALNLFPGILDKDCLKKIKKTGFLGEEYINELIRNYNPSEYDPESVARIISDEFLQELLERRSAPEFRNIVFSIQKKQGEIIQVPYDRDMVVQGCAGSGKSMIMMHRLPILLYDNPDVLGKSNLFIITPSQMYIQLAESMRQQLEISDVRMGTLEQYYDLCIARYSGHKAAEYGKIYRNRKISPELEDYIYSKQCINDIMGYFEELLAGSNIDLTSAMAVLNIPEDKVRTEKSFSQAISNRLSKVQAVLSTNKAMMHKYFIAIEDTIDSFKNLSVALRHRKNTIIGEIKRRIIIQEDTISVAQKEKSKLNPKDNRTAIQNRINTIEAAGEKIRYLKEIQELVSRDNEYFNKLLDLNSIVEMVIDRFKVIQSEYSKNTVRDVYNAIENIEQFQRGYDLLYGEFSKVEDKYIELVASLKRELAKVGQKVSSLQSMNDRLIDMEYYREIRQVRELLQNGSKGAVIKAYDFIMGKLGIKRSTNGNMRALKCSPYIYLQILFIFYGIPSYIGEKLLAIDEAQGIAPEELRLLKHVNGDKLVFNLYGDINQHIEGTKGIEAWDEYRSIIDFDIYHMGENYRNSSQITDYCNKRFSMNMVAINTPGKGVHEIDSEEEFRQAFIGQLVDSQKAGLAAIIVASDAEARYIENEFSEYENKFHDMTSEDFSIHRTRWNIIQINDAKGLEFSSVIAISGRMSKNQKYIAYTRALDDLYVYDEIIDVKEYEKKPKKQDSISQETKTPDLPDGDASESETSNSRLKSIHDNAVHEREIGSAVRQFFMEKGLEVIDKRKDGGRLWVIGNKENICGFVNEAIQTFGINGKYASSNESFNKPGWCTKTNK